MRFTDLRRPSADLRGGAHCPTFGIPVCGTKMKQTCAILLSIITMATGSAAGASSRFQVRGGAVSPSQSANQRRQFPERYPPGVVAGTPSAAALDGFNEWLKAGDRAPIKWETSVEILLQMNQKFGVRYSATTKVKNLERLGVDRELVFLFRADKVENETTNKTFPNRGAIVVPMDAARDVEIIFSESISLEPGDYNLWMALYDGAAKTHNLIGRQVHIAVPNDPLPQLQFQPAGKAILPVSNKRPLALDLISLYPDPQILELLAQMTLVDSSISVEVLDLEKQQMVFEQSNARPLDSRRLQQARARNSPGPAVDFSVLLESQTREDRVKRSQQATYFREFMRKKLEGPSSAFRVFIVLSNGRVFPHGNDLRSLKPDGDCRCRVFHLHHSSDTLNNDIQKVLRPLQPRLFEIPKAENLRKALAEIVRELESL